MRCVASGFLLLALVAATACAAADTPPPVAAPAAAPATEAAAKKQKAEYAFRWTLPQDHLATLAETVDWLVANAPLTKAGDDPELRVAYFSVAQPAGLPSGYQATLRQRGDDDWTYKVRGPAPAPATLPIPGCAPGTAEGEWDITTDLQGHPLQTMASLSCDGKGTASLPGSVSTLATSHARPCQITMQRARLAWADHKDVKVEYWRFVPQNNAPATTPLLEISWKAKASAGDQADFATVIANLPLKAAAEPTPGKEKMAEICDAASRP